MKAGQFKDFLKRRVNDLLKEYIAEAEHQDGSAHWTNFRSVSEGIKDFCLYVTNSELEEDEEEVEVDEDERDSRDKTYIVCYTRDGQTLEAEIKGPTPTHARVIFPREVGNYPIQSVKEKGA